MYTVQCAQVSAKAGEPVQITYTVVDNNGDAVNVATATAAFRIARRTGDAAIVVKTNGAGITLSTNTAVVLFETDELVDDEDEQLFGDFHMQLAITKSGDTLFVAEGPLQVAQVIT